MAMVTVESITADILIIFIILFITVAILIITVATRITFIMVIIPMHMQHRLQSSCSQRRSQL